MHWYRLIAPDFFLGKLLSTLRAIFDLIVLVARQPSRRSLRLVILVLKMKPRFTMVTTRNLVALYNLVQDVERQRLPGGIVECGVWNGGSAAMMAAATADAGYPNGPRRLWLFDSFEGLPLPSSRDGETIQRAYFGGWCKGEVENVQRAFTTLRLPLDHVEIVPGWFDTTLPATPVSDIAVLHIDADWYDSVKLVLETFYDRITPGGYVMLDDYGQWPGCNQAVTDFFAQRALMGLRPTQTAHGGAYFQIPTGHA